MAQRVLEEEDRARNLDDRNYMARTMLLSKHFQILFQSFRTSFQEAIKTWKYIN